MVSYTAWTRYPGSETLTWNLSEIGMQLRVSWDTVYAKGVIAGSPGLRCESELPWVKISPTNDLPHKGLLPTGKVLAITLSA